MSTTLILAALVFFGTAFVILRIRHGVALPVALVLLMMGVFCLSVALTM